MKNPSGIQIAIFTAIAGICLFSLSCKKSSNSMPSNSNPPANQVYMQNYSFNSSTITVMHGTTVTWTNKDNIVHTVTSNTSGLFNSGDIAAGQTYTHQFNDIGTFNYYCTYHVNMGMKGVVIVQ